MGSEEFLRKVIAGDIALAQRPGERMKQWRLLCDVSQKELANALRITASVISDYESGRRKKPGTEFLRKIVRSLCLLDAKKEHSFVSEMNASLRLGREETPVKSVHSKESISLSLLAQQVNGKVLVGDLQGECERIVWVTDSSSSLPETNERFFVVVSTHDLVRPLFVRVCLLDNRPVGFLIPTTNSLSEIDKRLAKVCSFFVLGIDGQKSDEIKQKIERLFSSL